MRLKVRSSCRPYSHPTHPTPAGFSTGLVNNRLVLLPITAVTANSPRRMNPRGRTVERLLQLTRQPDPLSDARVREAWERRNAVLAGKARGGEG